MFNAAQLITCRRGSVSVKVQSSQVKGQGASVSTDEISRIMDMPAVTAMLCLSDYRTSKSYVWKKRWREEGGGTDKMNKGYLKERLEMCLLS